MITIVKTLPPTIMSKPLLPHKIIAQHIGFDDRTGLIMPDPKVRGNVPYWFLSPVTTLAANTATNFDMKNQTDALLECIGIVATATQIDWSIRIVDVGSTRAYSKRLLKAPTCLGTPNFPYYFAHPMYLYPGERLNIELFNDSLILPVTLQICFLCKTYKIPQQVFGNNYRIELRNKRPVFYSTDEPIIIPAGGNIKRFFTVTEESDFYLKRTTSFSDGAFEIKISRNKSREGWQNRFIPSSLFASSASNQGFVYPDGDEVFVERSSVIQLDLNDLSGVDNRVFVTFGGINYYYARK